MKALCRALFVLSAAAISFYPNSVFASNTLGRLDVKPLKVLLVETADGVSLGLSVTDTKLSVSQISLQLIQQPDRLVIDVPRMPGNFTSRKLSISHPLISGLRLGAHPEKTRLVLDLKHQLHAPPSIQSIDNLGAILIHVPFSGAVTPPKDSISPVENVHQDPVGVTNAATETKPLAPTTDTTVRAKIDTGAFVNKDGIIVHRGLPQETSNPSTYSAKLRGIRFIASNDSALDTLVVEVDNIQGFTLTPLREGMYELQLRDCENLAKLPQPFGVGFEHLESAQRANTSVVTIQVHPTVSLAASLKANTLYLQATRLGGGN